MALKDLVLVQAGERTNTSGKAVTNRILLTVPDDEYNAIRPHLEYLALKRHNSVHEPNETPRFVYFPNSGLLSLVVVTSDGKTVEAGIVGKEGIVGLASAVGLSRNPLPEGVQIAGDRVKMGIAALQHTGQAQPQRQTLLYS